jgi:putative addiction module component (TIGR02574 family)
MKTDELFEEVVSLPVEERARLAERVLQSLNAPDAEMDALWAAEAQRRLADVRSGKVETVPGELVFERIRQPLMK